MSMVQAVDDAEARIASYAAYFEALYQDQQLSHEQEEQEETISIKVLTRHVTFENREAHIFASSLSREAKGPAQRLRASLLIQRWWRSQRQRRYYRHLVRRMQTAEACFTTQALRKFSPQEGGMADTKLMQMKIRFKLDGTLYPARIMYKLYTVGLRAQYVTGDAMLPILSDSAQAVWKGMGPPAYMKTQCYSKIPIHASSVASRQNYQAYLSQLDALPVHQGGRSNDWRLLTEETPIARMLIAYEQSLQSMAQWKKIQRAKKPQKDLAKERKDKLEQMRKLYLHERARDQGTSGRHGDLLITPSQAEEDPSSLLRWASTIDEVGVDFF